MKQFASIVNGRMIDIVPEYEVSGEGDDAALVPLTDRYPPEFIASLVPHETDSSQHEPPVAGASTPSVVTMRQARLALLAAGKLQAISDAIDALPSPQKEAAQIEWEFATEVARASPFLASLAAALELDDDAIDALFVAAAQL